MKRVVIVAGLVALIAAPAAAQDSSPELLAAARAHLAAHHLDSAAVAFRRVAGAPERSASDRIQAWGMLGVVGFFRTRGSATAHAVRHPPAVGPGLQGAAPAPVRP